MRLVLTYHTIDDISSVTCTPPELFHAQLTCWKQQGWHFLTYDEFAAKTSERQDSQGRREMLITFDDALESVYQTAFPILKKLEIPAHIFVVSQCMEEDKPQSRFSDLFLGRMTMSWQQAASMSGPLISFGSHSCNHPHLRSVSAEEGEYELRESKIHIQNRLGVDVTSFAYPYGDRSLQIEQIARKYYTHGFTTEMRRIGPKEESLALPRIDAYYLRPTWAYQSLHTFLNGGYLRARQFIRSMH